VIGSWPLAPVPTMSSGAKKVYYNFQGQMPAVELENEPFLPLARLAARRRQPRLPPPRRASPPRAGARVPGRSSSGSLDANGFYGNLLTL